MDTILVICNIIVFGKLWLTLTFEWSIVKFQRLNRLNRGVKVKMKGIWKVYANEGISGNEATIA